MATEKKLARIAKKKLLVVLGAGSSIGCGMPSVKEIDALMDKWSDDWASKHNLTNHYRALTEAITRYYQGGRRPGPSVNFERVLGDMVALSHWLRPAPDGDTLRQVACEGAEPPFLTFKSASFPEFSGPYAGTQEVTDQLAYLLVELARHLRSLSVNIETANASFQAYRAIVEAMEDAFEVGVYNLNYDALALRAWPHVFTGFDGNGVFDAAAVHRRQQWDFVYHLHGSVHYSMFPRRGNGPIVWHKDLNAEFNDGEPGLPQDMRSDGKQLPKTTLVAGGNKLDQLLVEPFHSFHAALARHVYEADAILIGGYGFADEHVNRALQNRFETMSRPPVIVLDKAPDCAGPMSVRKDLWTSQLTRALDSPKDSFAEPGNPQFYSIPRQLVEKGAFEVSHSLRVALWHGGFLEATSRLDRIVQWLWGKDEQL